MKLKEFQGLRGVAFLLVFISHSIMWNINNHSAFNWLGAFGVSIFLVLSGFLAGYQSQKIDKYSKNYFVKKLAKVYPMHVVMLIVFLIQSGSGKEMLSSIMDMKFITNLFLLQAWIPKWDFYWSYNAVSWYLSVYVFCVIATPTLICFTKKLTGKQLVSILILINVVQFLIVFFSREINSQHWIVYICPAVRVLDFVAGMNCYYLSEMSCKKNYMNYKIILFFGLFFALIAVLCSIAFESELFASWIWMPISICVVSGLYIKEIVNDDSSSFFSSRILIGVGNSSFYAFLIHKYIIKQVQTIIGINIKYTWEKTIFVFCVALIVTELISYCLYRFSVLLKEKKYGSIK